MRLFLYVAICYIFVGCAKEEMIGGYSDEDIIKKTEKLEDRLNRRDDKLNTLESKLEQQQQVLSDINNTLATQNKIAGNLAKIALAQKKITEDLKSQANPIEQENKREVKKTIEIKNEVKRDIDIKRDVEIKREPEPTREVKNTIEKFTPSTFRVISEANVYDSYEGQTVVANWEVGKKFTAYRKTKDRVNVSGQFAEGKWVAVQTQIWIDLTQVSNLK